MTIHYGKRNPGALTAASPGDTLYFNFASYNDSGDSEALSGFTVSDIEVSKNGSATVRATDSGYSLISDTGQFGDRVGLYRFSVQLFNTADDASFYAVGSWYQVAVDAVSIDGKTVRFWAGSFEIGEPRANIVQISGDTGAANYLKNTFANGFADTGVQDNLSRIRADVDTGLRVHIDDLDTGLHDTLSDYDTGVRALLTLRDTGAIANAVWGFATRGITAISDTGLNDNLSRIRSDVDTGLRVHIDDLDTGLHAHISDVDTGIHSILQATGVLVSAFSDTGVNSRLSAIQTQTDKLTFDTGNEILADIRKVNRVTVQGAGDTGSDNTWRPGT